MRRRGSRSLLDPQPWPWPSPRVLIEEPDEAAGRVWADCLRHAGYAVAVCTGPHDRERCPLAGADGCATAGGADVIVSSLGFESPQAREVLQALRLRFPDVPVIVEASRDEQKGEWSDVLAGCTVIEPPLLPDQLVTTVEAALGRQPGTAA